MSRVTHTTLKDARGAKGWTQEELESRSGVDQRHISRIERGDIADPRNSTVVALEGALGVKRGTLVFGTLQRDEALAS